MSHQEERRRCFISGRVQGVCFRAHTRDQARQLGLAGYARNLPDGRVEVLLCGPPEAVATMQAWLHRGPPAARVDDVECAATDASPPTAGAFTIG
ncbi:acylphosphatase [Halorhodospira abdelmalekii]|uniref:acylphosphatase n=1 Tax=Halorhodospira abdelmalekii TaxID=421629 RepID=UPI001903781B|nr:acylphosphatase [Halorhodospira abdelmalekii]MBK1735055.1 acylphosphatase [Halorhodospira abdelmalekii]